MTDSGFILDNAEIEFLLDGALSGQGAETSFEAAPPPDQAVTMHGQLDQINLSDIFQTISMAKMEGVLRVHNPLELRQIYCQDGYVRVLAPPRVVHRRIGQRLVHAGLISKEQLRSALMRQRKERVPLGQMLVADGALTQEAVDEVVNHQAAEDLFTLFTWRHGSFEFFKGPVTDETLYERFSACPEFEVASLLREVNRRASEWDDVFDAIRSLDEVPARATAEPEQALSDAESVLFHGADGYTTFRTLAEHTTLSLFDVSRAARDLVKQGTLRLIADQDMVAVASALVENGQNKPAVMLLQTLLDRPGMRELDVLRDVADVLKRCGENPLAGRILFERAQLHAHEDFALDLAREAHALLPSDVPALQFLRKVLLTRADADPQEVERCTIGLLDSFVDGERYDEALELVAEARAAGAATTRLLSREARLRHKQKDIVGALAVYDEVIAICREQGDKKRLAETFEAILRLDHKRADARKFLQRQKLSRTARLLRLALTSACVGLLGWGGIVYWQQHRFESDLRAAAEEINELLRAGNRTEARERLDFWTVRLGNGEAIDDLRRQVNFADAAELQRKNREVRQRLTEQLTAAAEKLNQGDLRGAFEIYGATRDSAELRDEVDGVIATRVGALLDEVAETAKRMSTRMPPEPSSLLDRRELVANLADLQATCPPALRKVVKELDVLIVGRELPGFLGDGLRRRIADEVLAWRDTYTKSQRLAEAYTEALQRNESQRRFDPIFKEALRREEVHDFAGALELFRQLEGVDAAGAELRGIFRDHVTRNATIVRFVDALDRATSAGDYASARQHLRALEMSFPEVPFRSLVRLPLRIETLPAGARVICNGSEVGVTPCTIAYVPADPNRLAIQLDGFRGYESGISADGDGKLQLRLRYLPTHTHHHENVVEVPPVTAPLGQTFLVDRDGVVTALALDTSRELWRYRSGDLSGLLSRAFCYGSVAVVASLDGELRALTTRTGAVAWSLPNLATEVEPVQADGTLAIATTDDRLCLVDLDTQTVRRRALPDGSRASLGTDGKRVFAATRGGVTCVGIDSPAHDWKVDLPDAGERWLVVAGDALVTVDDRGNVVCFDTATGTRRWKHVETTLLLGKPVVGDDTVLLATARHIVRLSLADGGTRREFVPEGALCSGQPLLVGRRLLVPTDQAEVQVLDLVTGEPLYALDASRRGTVLLPWRKGVAVALPDRKVHFYQTLR